MKYREGNNKLTGNVIRFEEKAPGNAVDAHDSTPHLQPIA